MSDEILPFDPGDAQQQQNRRRLANFLRTAADHIEANDMAAEPYDVVLVLIGKETAEVAGKGVSREDLIRAGYAVLHKSGHIKDPKDNPR